MRTIFTLVLFMFLAFHSIAQQATSTAQEIYLVRHAKVDMRRPGFINSDKAAKLLENYNTAPIVDFDPEIVRKMFPNDNVKIYSSTLPRSIATADRFFPNDSITAYSVFNEYQMGIVSISLLHMPYSFWTGISRLLWFTGLNNQAESRSDSRERLTVAADLLEELALNDNQIILFSHGFFISELRKELRKRGWEITRNGGNKNLSVTHLTNLR